MHIELELDDLHAERLLALQKRLEKPLPEIIKDLLAKAVDEYCPPTEGAKVLSILEKHGILGCMEGDGKLSVDYKKHLWGQE